MFTILSDDRYTPQRHNMRLTSVQGAQMIEAVLKSWMLRGVFNINIAAGSMNVLYESMQKDKALSMVVLPEPVGPVTKIIPWGLRRAASKFSCTLSGMFNCFKPSWPEA